MITARVGADGGQMGEVGSQHYPKGLRNVKIMDSFWHFPNSFSVEMKLNHKYLLLQI